MKYSADVQSALNEPVALEELYQKSLADNAEAEFRSDLQAEADKTPGNLLLQAWQARFTHIPLVRYKRSINWGLAIVLGMLTGLILWAISDPAWLVLDTLPYFLLLWAPIATIPALIYLVVTSRKNYAFAAFASVALVVACVYILLISPRMTPRGSMDYLTLMILMLPLICWIGIGVTTMRFRSASPERFAFLVKSIEVAIAAAVYLGFGLVFGAITLGLFASLNVTLPELVIRLIAAGGFGLLPILAVATIYDPRVSPRAQDFNGGLTRFVFTIVRLLLPLTLLVLLIYIFVIPFNFIAPFQNREILIIYNVMQFAIIGLLIGCTPLITGDLSPIIQAWLRRGIIAVAVLALLISLYALSAVVYRTVQDGLTQNRTAVIGWNAINIGILAALVVTQARKSTLAWHERLQSVFSKATTVYLVWAMLLIVFLPLLFK